MTDCGLGVDLGSPEFLARFRATVFRERIPVAGSFDLTYRCNLRCVHCYVGHRVAEPASGAGELATADVVRLIREAAEAGCLNVALSGGEPLLRRDFAAIYEAAVRAGIRTTVFTNATLVDSDILDLWVEYPPNAVDVSLYGATRETYERVTGVLGSYERAMRGVRGLIDRGITVALKTMILRSNASEVRQIEMLADELGAEFRLDPIVTPRLDGDLAPLGERVDPARAVAFEMASQKRLGLTAKHYERVMADQESDSLYQCGAGRVGFHVDPQGTLRPCVMTQAVHADAYRAGFEQAWSSVTEVVSRLRRSNDSPCAGCGMRAICGVCVGLSELETGSSEGAPGYLCRVGSERLGMIQAGSQRGAGSA